MFHILHTYKLNMKNVSISLSTITYKRHINIVVYTQYDDLCAVPVSVKCFYLIKIFFLQRKCITLKVSYTWTYLMPHLHKQLMFISLVTSMVWGIGPTEWDPVMRVTNVWIPERDTSSPAKSVSQCSNKALHQGSNYSFKLLKYLCSCYEWGPLACNNYKCNSKSVHLYTHLVGLLRQENGPSQGTQKNTDIYPCSEWNSNPQSQHPSSIRQYITYAHSGCQTCLYKR